MVVFLSIILLFLPLLYITDIYQSIPEKPKEDPLYVPPKPKVQEAKSPGRAQPEIPEQAEESEETSKVIETAQESKELEIPEPETPQKRRGGLLYRFLESHLLFGIFFYRPSFTRVLRAFTLATVIMFEFLLEGLMFMIFENTDKGDARSTQELLDTYTEAYFGYMLIALIIALPVEFYLSTCLSTNRDHGVCWVTSALVFGFSILLGSIVGITLLTFEYCHE